MWLFHKTTVLSRSGLLKGMVDCHSHLLPGVDDGVQSMEESLQILREMEQQGIRRVWRTPHIMEDIPNETFFVGGDLLLQPSDGSFVRSATHSKERLLSFAGTSGTV